MQTPLLWLGWLLIGCPACAQTGPGNRAQVYAVAEADFNVPQVKLPAAAVARRINRRLLRLVLGAHAEEVDSLGTARQQLHQARRACCYDAQAKAWTNSSHGFTGTDYRVLLNQDFLLSLELDFAFMGAYPSQGTGHVTFDLRTGRQLQLADVVADPPAQLARRLEGAVNRRIAETLATEAKDNDAATMAEVTRLMHWNATAQRVSFAPPDAAPAVGLTEFALTPQALLLFYRTDLPHAIQVLDADATYHFPYARLQPRGPLLPWARAAHPARKP